MKKIVAAALLAAAPIGAQAADMPVKTPIYKTSTAYVYDWTGFYFGVNAGVSVGRDLTRVSVAALSFEQTHLSPLGAIGGVQAGYNWQAGKWVFGLEADIQASGQRDNGNCLFFCIPTTDQMRIDRKLDWFGTARGRIGYATGPVLSYVTGGFAYGDVKTTINESLLVAGFGGLPPVVQVNGTFINNQVRAGFTLGSGVEAALGGNWTGKIEYLYVDLGSYTGTYALAGAPHTVNTEYRDHIFRAGLNYRIGGNAAAMPVAAANWAGFYVGGNAGGAIARDRSQLVGLVHNDQFNLVPDGYAGGVQAGYNWQSGAWVFGVEADIQGSSLRDNQACITTCTVAFSTSLDQRLSWFGTARGRLGYTVGSTLFYGTGGVAYGNVRTRITEINAAASDVFIFDSNRTGWTAGGGIETPLEFLGLFGPNWTSKTEYLYVNLGETSNVFLGVAGPRTFTTRVQEHVFRTGLNYHFDAPVVAKY